MSKKIKIWIIIASLIMLLGTMIFTISIIAVGGDLMNLSTNKFQTNEYQITEEFNSITIITNTADIEVVSSNAQISSVTCFEEKNLNHAVTIEDKTLKIELVNTKKWYEYIGINFHSPTITVSIPQAEYDALYIKSNTGSVNITDNFKFQSVDITENTGSINLENLSTTSIKLSTTTGKMNLSQIDCDGELELKISTGKTFLNKINCKNLVSTGGTGDILLKDVIATQSLSIKRSTGDVEFEAIDANEITITTETGDVEGSLLSSKIFTVNTNTGKKEVPESITGGKCKITTNTGDIKISLK